MFIHQLVLAKAPGLDAHEKGCFRPLWNVTLVPPSASRMAPIRRRSARKNHAKEAPSWSVLMKSGGSGIRYRSAEKTRR